MPEEIINRVANSKLITIDLEDLYPKGERVAFDIAPWLMEGIVLKETDFRKSVEAHNWSQYKDSFVALYCSTDAIIPGWAYLLLTVHLSPFAKKVVVGNTNLLETILFSEILNNLDLSTYLDKTVIIKGCAEKAIPENAYIMLASRLQPISQKIMYGEACSAVPLYRKK